MALSAELLYAANEAGVPNEDIFVDGIVTPVNIQQPQLMSLMAYQEMVGEMFPGVKSTCGLSNISNRPPGPPASHSESNLYGDAGAERDVFRDFRCL
jgi:Methionine synthase I, cobalamin-binding domain